MEVERSQHVSRDLGGDSSTRAPRSPRHHRNGDGASSRDLGRGRESGVVRERTEEDKQAAAKAEYEKLLTMRSGGTYIPPARLRALQSQITDKTSKEYQRMAWEALKKSINGLINKINVSNIKHIVPELFGENLVRGRGLFCRSIMKAQAASLPFTPIYATMVAIVNTKLPQIGELLLKRLITQFKKGFKRNDKAVADEMIAAQILLLLLNKPTDDSVEIAVGFTREVGQHLEEMSGPIALAVFDQFRSILHEADIDKRVQYMIEVLFQVRKDKYKDNPAIKGELDLVEEEDQITHRLALDDQIDVQDGLNIFKFDPEWEENEEAYKQVKAEILGGGSDDEEDDEDDTDDSDDDEEKKEDKALEIKDQSNTDLVNLRRTIYLTIMSSIDPEECCHKLMKVQLPAGQEQELPSMVIECCAQEKTYSKFYGLIGERFAKINRLWTDQFEQQFTKYYDTIHRYETNRLRNIARFFGHLISSDAIGWHVFSVIHLNEEETTSSSRIFIKILFQDLSEAMGMPKLQARLRDNLTRPYFEGLFPRDNDRNTRFSINYFTSIGMGAVTEEMREYLQNKPKPSLPAPVAAADDSDSESGSSVSSYSSYTGSSYSGSRSPSPTRVLDRRRSPSRTPPRNSKGKARERGRSLTRSMTRSVTPPRRNARQVSRSLTPPRRAGRDFSDSRSPSPRWNTRRDSYSVTPPVKRARSPTRSRSPPRKRPNRRNTSSVSAAPRRRHDESTSRSPPPRRRRRDSFSVSPRRRSRRDDMTRDLPLRKEVDDTSQFRRTSIKRPWEEDANSPERGSAWHSALLPPIDSVPYRRGSVHQGPDEGSKEPTWKGPDPEESVMKKAKFEGHDYNPFPRQNLAPNGKIPPSRNLNTIHAQHRGSLESPPYPLKVPNGPTNGRPNDTGPADSHDPPNLCQRCRRLTIQNRESDIIGDPDSCDDCKRNPELAWVSREMCIWLTHLTDTLSSGVSSEERGIVRGADHLRSTTSAPPIEIFGLKQTLNWVLGRIHHVNQLADQLVGHVPAGSLQNRGKDSYSNGTKSHGGSADIMKRRIDVDSDDLNDGNSSSDSKPPHTRRRSVTTSMLANEELPPLRSQRPDYYPPLPSIEGPVQQRASGMNPPPAPNRQLPSPPARSLASPTSLSFPSPSTPSYGINVNLLPPSNLHQQSNSNYLPPITAARSPDSALRDHTAALQHEVSVQKIALSSLQGEHDKLLAAYSRSQTRASALETKHAVSDTEIISLTEEKLRLQAQVIELERDVEELARSRDEFRQAAVREGAQYVEIVQRASRLEEIAGEEKKQWCRLRGDMERTITEFKAVKNGEREGMGHTENVPLISRPDEMDTNTLVSSEELVTGMKMEVATEPQSMAPTLDASSQSVPQESVEDLKMEILRLRERCADVENALRAIRDDSRSMEQIVNTLVERADSTLQS
ncbi:Pre-mRNA-splicing factor cwc22 [Hyphodiscus hymeniophilus]|uniref:Pre-mRNA-splicing factor CWC22 n=1 Tax=Hyphodiscus hymeniophilus TaxID=353542 RepID=A0A9P7AUK9_9HELO|nr:Pre-mRNA-splicing factor cwc22 [Hyphodiscus hymeniophilus]